MDDATPSASQMLLPVEAYTSRDWYDREQRNLFGRAWQFAGMVSDIPESGQYICRELGAYPIIVVRGDSGELRAFHNICRHRGTQLLEVTGKRKKVIKCPYHDWVYSLDGELIGLPEKRTQFPNLDMRQWSLFPAALAVWKEMIFVNPSADAEDFAEWLGEFPQWFGPHQVETLQEADKEVYEVKANWKIFVENYIDVYHLAHLHSDTLNMYEHAKLESAFVGAGHVATYDPPTRDYRHYLETEGNSYMPMLFDEPKHWGAWTHMMFPNFGIAGSEYTWSTVEVIPLEPERTRVEIRTWIKPVGRITMALGSGYMKVSSWLSGRDEENPLASGDFMQEDIYACEQQQKAMRSPRFAFGPTSVDKEQLIINFQRKALSYLE